MDETSIHNLTDDAKAIWWAGVKAALPDELLPRFVRVEGDALVVGTESWPLSRLRRIVVLGAGKAGASMSLALEAALGPEVTDRLVVGQVNVPEDCLVATRKIHLVGARPAGVNEPTVMGVASTREILDIAATTTADDLVIILLSGGGSALLPLPRPPITLEQKQQVIRLLATRGASIEQLNLVRRNISDVKGGGMARALGPGRAYVLVISDVIGNPLDLIASGPLMPTPDEFVERERQAAHDTLAAFAAREEVATEVWSVLSGEITQTLSPVRAQITHHLLASNHQAVQAAELEAKNRGYRIRAAVSDVGRTADEVGTDLAHAVADETCRESLCWISGGEPTVTLVPYDGPRKGGRNQQVALAALCEWQHWEPDQADRMVLLSGGTDGEDGPTTCAGAIANGGVLRKAREIGLDPQAFLDVQNAWPFFEETGGLLTTGPTHTNVMDLRVALRLPG
ncbi:MAG: glycerate kinase [Planctomyces sp.]|nr:glycerate kinase [Planctomyces sp.]